MTQTLIARLTATASIRGVECVAEAMHDSDEYGPFTVVEIFTHDGGPMAELDVDGYMTQGDLSALLGQLSRGATPAGVDIAWADSNGLVA